MLRLCFKYNAQKGLTSTSKLRRLYVHKLHIKANEHNIDIDSLHSYLLLAPIQFRRFANLDLS